MNNAPAILKSLVIYALCVPLAVIVGYMLTDPLDYTTFAYAGVLGLGLFSPLLFRWHYPLLLFSLNTTAILFFIKGRPAFWLVMVALSLGMSLLERAMNSQKRFIRVPQITWPLIYMIGVVLFTAKLTGGIGLHAFGSEVYGGKKYFFLVMSILSYFAFTAQRIPPERVNLYVALLLLGGVTWFIGDMYPITPAFLHFIFWMFPPTSASVETIELGVTRLGGVGFAALAFVFWLGARYGLRGIFLSGKLWRPVLFIMGSLMIFLGGFRIAIITYLGIFGSLFFLERLHRTRALLIFVMIGILGISLIIPFSSRLPFTFQRTLAFLPLNISAEARQSAEDSTKWRIEMWEALLPQISQHLLLGEGYAISMEDVQMLGRDVAFRPIDASQQGLALAHDYHNGPISVVLPFGIWGVIALLWFVSAGFPVMYRNFRYGDPALRTINTFMWVHYLYLCFSFLIIGESLVTDMMMFTGDLGLSIALNGGVCRPPPQPAREKQALDLVKPFPRPHPAFQR